MFGVTRHALVASQAVAHAIVASLGDMQVQVAAEVGLNYIALRSAQVRWRIANDNLASQQGTPQITRWRQQSGLVTELDATQARTAVEQTQALLPVLQTTIAQTNHALLVLTNQPPNAPWPSTAAPLGTVSPLPFAGGELTLNIPAETLRQRADVRVSEYQVAAALARVAQADAARRPRSAQPCRPVARSRQGDRKLDWRQRRTRRAERSAGRSGRPDDGGSGWFDQARHGHRRRDQCGQRRAECRRFTAWNRRQPNGSGHSTERSSGGRECCCVGDA